MDKPDFRPILRQAAAAAGYVVVGDAEDGLSLMLKDREAPWNPEDNDADAFGLMAALKIMPMYGRDGIGAIRLTDLKSRKSCGYWSCKDGSPEDHVRQTMRFAIVCEASKIFLESHANKPLDCT